MDDAAAASALLRRAGGLPSSVPVEEAFPSSFRRQWRDFKRSGPLKKMGVVTPEGLVTLPRATAVLMETVASGNPIGEHVLPNGRTILVDFLRKIGIVLNKEGDTISPTFPFYWVDEEGELFMSARLGGVDEAFVRQAFEEPSQGRLTITGVRRCRHREALVFGFLEKMKTSAWLFGWYGEPAADVQEAADGGGLAANWQVIGAAQAHGRGVHVSSRDSLEPSASLSLQSAKGNPAQVLFCALAPGVREVVPVGSSQSQPSNAWFHTAVDSVYRTKWHVFWEGTAKNSILPLYSVTFSADGMSKLRQERQIG